MGVAGAGKTSVGRMLAKALGYEFRDADGFHPAANVEKMRRGAQLDDEDRAPWLQALASAIDTWLQNGTDVVLACSALKASYRAVLLRDLSRMRLVYLKVAPALARERVAGRPGHFMPDDLVDSQFEALEEPDAAISVDASQPPDAIVRSIHDGLKPGNTRSP